MGHSEAYFLMSPGRDNWKCMDCFQETDPSWTVEHRHVTGLFSHLVSPKCTCGGNPFYVSFVAGCRSFVATYSCHVDEINAGDIFQSKIM